MVHCCPVTAVNGADARCSSLSDADASRFNISAQEKADFMEEVTTELSVYLAMLYHMVEIFKGHDDFADELSKFDPATELCQLLLIACGPVSLEPPLPVYLFNVVAGLRDKSAKGYPVKKVRLIIDTAMISISSGFAASTGPLEDPPDVLWRHT